MRTTPSGQNVTSFAVATNYFWTDQAGQKQKKAEFHNVVAWRRLAEICSQYMHKGSKVYVEGRLQTREWTDQAGIKKYRTEIIADNVELLDSRSGNGGGANGGAEDSGAIEEVNNEEEIKIEDIPF